jgi:TonB family protein
MISRKAPVVFGLWVLIGCSIAYPAQDAVIDSKSVMEAAEKGDADAQYRLGVLYKNGVGVEQDYVQAYKWLCLSVYATGEQGNKATKMRTAVVALMTRDQLDEARSLVNKWQNERMQNWMAEKGGEINAPYLSGNLKYPVPIIKPGPIYTIEARKAKVEGDMFLRCIVRKTGIVGACVVLKGIGYGLDESAVETITKYWKFQPGASNGNAIDVVIDLGVKFRLF